MSKEDERSNGVHGDHNVIPGDCRWTATNSQRLPEHVRKKDQLGSPGLMIRFPVMGHDHSTGARSKNGRTESDERFWRLGRQSSSPVQEADRPRESTEMKSIA